MDRTDLSGQNAFQGLYDLFPVLDAISNGLTDEPASTSDRRIVVYAKRRQPWNQDRKSTLPKKTVDPEVIVPQHGSRKRKAENGTTIHVAAKFGKVSSDTTNTGVPHALSLRHTNSL